MDVCVECGIESYIVGEFMCEHCYDHFYGED